MYICICVYIALALACIIAMLFYAVSLSLLRKDACHTSINVNDEKPFEILAAAAASVPSHCCLANCQVSVLVAAPAAENAVQQWLLRSS